MKLVITKFGLNWPISWGVSFDLYCSMTLFMLTDVGNNRDMSLSKCQLFAITTWHLICLTIFCSSSTYKKLQPMSDRAIDKRYMHGAAHSFLFLLSTANGKVWIVSINIVHSLMINSRFLSILNVENSLLMSKHQLISHPNCNYALLALKWWYTWH